MDDPNEASLVQSPEPIQPAPQSEPGTGQSPWLEAAILFLIFSAIAAKLSQTGADADLWGHLRFGLDTLLSGQIARTDPYSYTAFGLPWINHEWLAELAFALAWQSAGSAGLVLLKMVCWLATLAVLVGYLLRLGFPALRAGLIVLPAFLLMLPGAGTVRPHMFTAMAFVLTLLAIVLADEGRLRWLWLLPPVFALWANLHGGFLVGILFLVVWTVMHLLAHPRDWKTVLPPALVSLLALLANPYQDELLLFLARTASGTRPDISEWAPLPIQSWLGAGYLLAVGLTVLAVFASTKRGSQPDSDGQAPAGLSAARLALLGLACVLPLMAQRHIVLFAVAVPLLAGPAFLAAWPARTTQPSTSRLMIVFSALAGAALLGWAGLSLGRIELPESPKYPLGAVALLQQSGLGGNLAVNFDWGEYAIWHLAPTIKVSVDGRRETVYPDEVYRQNLRLRFGVADWQAVLEEYPTDMVLTRRGEPTDSLLRLTPAWTLVYEDDASVLYARRGSLAETRLLVFAPLFQQPEIRATFP